MHVATSRQGVTRRSGLFSPVLGALMSTLSLIGFSPQPPLSGGGVTHSFRLRSDELEPLRGPFSRSRKPVDNSVRIYVPGRAASRAATEQEPLIPTPVPAADQLDGKCWGTHLQPRPAARAVFRLFDSGAPWRALGGGPPGRRSPLRTAPPTQPILPVRVVSTCQPGVPVGSADRSDPRSTRWWPLSA